MNRGIPFFTILLSAILAAAPARAEREDKHEGAAPAEGSHRPGSGKTREAGKPHPKARQGAPRHEPGRRHDQVRPPERARPEPAHPRPVSPERVRPEPTPRPVWKTTRRESPKPMMPAPERRDEDRRDEHPENEKQARREDKPLKPAPITDQRHFVRRWTPPPAPGKDDKGGAWTAKPVTRPPRHDEVRHFDDPGLVSRLAAIERGEREPNRYYWHHDGDADYVHCYRGGQHWYGFWAGGSYFWTRYHAGRWWWYDPAGARYVYYSGGNWWWQDPAAPQVVYVYENDSYVPYAEPAPAESRYVVSNNETLVTSERPRDFVVYSATAAPAGAPAPAYASDVDAPTYSAKPDPNRFALVVGVESYASLPPAEFAARDAAAVRAHLRALGYPDRNVVVLTSSEAARASVAKYVESWLPERVNAASRVFVYFAGHGAPDPKTGAAYLMPWDGDAKYLSDTGYPLKRLYEKLNALPSREIVVALDSCFSGTGGRSVPPAGARPLVSGVDLARGAAGRLVVFSASGPSEISGDAAPQGHGLFTYWFLKGLNGAASGGKDGVTVQALYDYLAPNVEDAARRDNRDQTPQLLVPPDGQRQLLIEDLR